MEYMMQTMPFFGPTFILEMPTDWFVGASAQFQAALRSPMPDGNIFPNVVITIRRLEEGVTLRDVIVGAREIQEKEYPAYTVLSESPLTTNSVPGIRRKFEWQPPGRDTGVHQQQISFLKGQQLYTLTATRAANSAKSSEIDQLFDHIVGSFEFRASQTGR
jgi:hypothetical protein